MSVEYVKYHDGKIFVRKWQSNLSLNSNLMDVHIHRHPSSSWWSETIFLWHVTEKLNIFCWILCLNTRYICFLSGGTCMWAVYKWIKDYASRIELYLLILE